MNKIIINGKELTWNELAKIVGEKEVETLEITTEFPDGELKLSFEEECIDPSDDFGWAYEYSYFNNSFNGFIGQTSDAYKPAYISINKNGLYISSHEDNKILVYPEEGKTLSFNDNVLKVD